MNEVYLVFDLSASEEGSRLIVVLMLLILG